MTREQIIEKWDGMTPRERDTWVAEAVFGRVDEKWDGMSGHDIAGVWHLHVPNYTGDNDAAMHVLAKIPGEVYIYRKPSGGFVVSFGYSTEGCPECGEEAFEVLAQGIAPTLSEAICLTALIAKLTKGESA